MKAKYLGHPDLRDESPRTVGFAGKTFPRGHFVDVSDVDERSRGKLGANPAFVCSDEPLTDKERAEAEAVSSAFPAPVEGASKPDVGGLDKPALLLRLAELKEKHPDAEFSFSEKMGAPKLRQVLEEALFLIGDDE